MKKLLLAITFLLTFGLSAQDKGFGNEYLFASDNFIRIDYQYHFVGGALFAMPGYFLGLDLYDGDRSKAIWTGITVGTGVGVMKELTDIGKTGFDTNDLVWTFVGAAVSTWITDKIHYPNHIKRQKQEIKEMERERIAALTDEEKLLEEINNRL